jgi:single-stranded-DNA-specific exonuclease
MKYNWILPENNHTEKLLAERILLNRKIENVDLFINPSFEKHLRDANDLKDINKAVEIADNYIETNRKILVFGDYDADGVTSTALLYSFLKEVKANCAFHIPHRLKDGYGITVDGVRYAKEINVELIITVDNGIAANEAVDLANELGIEVIITDHHKQNGDLPKASAIVNPNQKDCNYPFKGISGVGVAFKFIQLLSKKLMNDEDREHFLKWNLDLVAMGTVADVMPILDENRIFVYYGLKVISKSKRIGIRALLDSIYEDGKADTVTIGYKIGPRINAAGRLEAADKALNLLLTEDENEAKALAKELNEINKRRQTITEDAVKEASKMIIGNEAIIILKNEMWHLGIIGLIAARLSETHFKPVLIFTKDEETGNLKSSGRSPEYFDITKAIMSLEEILIAGGGHRQACGCTIAYKDYEKFQDSMKIYSEKAIQDDMLLPDLNVDTTLDASEIHFDSLKEIQRLSPYGQSFSEPVLLSNKFHIDYMRTVGYEGKHLQLTLKKDGIVYKAIGFKMGNYTKRFKIGQQIDIVYSLSKNEWKGKVDLQLILKDMKLNE